MRIDDETELLFSLFSEEWGGNATGKFKERKATHKITEWIKRDEREPFFIKIKILLLL